MSDPTGGWPVHWNAPWIWYRTPPSALLFQDAPAEEEHRDAFVLLRRTVSLDAATEARARVTADGRYVLWVNGQECGRGPIRSEPGTLYYDEVDLGDLLVTGVNVVSVLVRHYGAPAPWWAPSGPYGELGRGGLVMEVEGLPALSTGSGWRVLRGPWIQRPTLLFGPPNEEVDARELPRGWRGADFDDSDWAPAVELNRVGAWGLVGGGPPCPPYTVVEANPLPPQTDHLRTGRPVARARSVGDHPHQPGGIVRLEAADLRGGAFEAATGPLDLPVSLQAGEALTVDFGEIVLGLPRVTVEAEHGAAVVLRSGERLREGAASDDSRMWMHRRVCHEGTQVVEPFEIAGMRYLTVTAEQPLTLVDVGLRERRYPLTVDGFFDCDDPALGDLWRLGARTLQLCATDAYLDCPGREQRAWLGDAYVHSLINYVTCEDARLARHVLDLAARSRHVDGTLGMIAAGDFSGSPLTIPDYSLHFIRSVRQAFWHTASPDPLEPLVTVGEGVLDWFWRFVEGDVLDRVPGWVFIDWWPLASDAPSATLQGLMVLALDDHAELAEAFDQPRAARRSRARAAQLREGMAKYLHPDGDRVVEHLGRTVCTQHAVAMAILTGTVSGEHAEQLLLRAVEADRLRYPGSVEEGVAAHGLPTDFDPDKHVVATQPFFAHWLHQAMASLGRQDLVLDSIRRWEPYLHTGDGTVWEFWAESRDTGSHAHAWSATPTYDLSTHVLGVRPASPGYASVSVQPWFGPLSSLRGSVPTPHGPVQLDLRRAGSRLTGTVLLPAGVSGDFAPAEGEPEDIRALRPGRNVIG